MTMVQKLETQIGVCIVTLSIGNHEATVEAITICLLDALEGDGRAVCVSVIAMDAG